MAYYSSQSVAVTDRCFAVFGEAATYQAPPADAVAITVIRESRRMDEELAAGSYEMVAVREAELAGRPRRGDLVTLGAVEYVVEALRDPDPADGQITLQLARRAGQV